MFAFFGKFYKLCFLERSVLKIRPFALLPTLYSIGILSLSPAPTHLHTAFTNNDRLCAIVRQFMKLATIEEVECGQ